MWRTVRKVLRWVARIGLGVLALMIIVLGAALIVIHTDWGRERIRKQVELVLRDVLPGGAKIGKIEGSVFTTLIVRDVEIDTMLHKPLVKVGSVSVSAAIWPLISKTVHVASVVVDDVHLDPAAGPLMPPRPDDKSPPPAWRIELPHIEVHRVAVDLGDPTMLVHELELAANVTVIGTDVAAYAWLDTGWGDKRVAAAASVTIDGNGIRVPAALVTMDAGGGRARVGVTDLLVDVDRPKGTLLVSAPAPVVGVWWPALAQQAALGTPLGDAVLRVELDREGADATKIALTGRTAAAAIDATLHGVIAKRTVRGVIALTDLPLAPLTRESLDGSGAIVVALDGSLQQARAKLAVLPSLVARPEAATLASLDRAAAAMAKGGSLDAIGTELAGAGAPATPRVFVSGEIIKLGPSWTLVGARAAGTIAGVSAAGQPVRGRVAFHVHAQAPDEPVLPKHPPAFLVDANVDGGLELRGGGFQTFSVGRAGVNFAGHIKGSELDVRGALTAERIANAGAPIGNARVNVAYRTGRPIAVDIAARPTAVPISADVSAQVALGDTIRIDLAKLGVQLPDGKRWNGGGGVVTIGDRIVLRGLGLRLREAALQVDATFDTQRKDLSAKITAAKIDLATLNPKLRGLGSSVITVERRRNRWSADAKLEISGLAAGKAAPPTDASARLTLAGDKLNLDVRASSPDTGELDLEIETAAPRDPTDVAAWLRLDAKAIHTAKLSAHQLQLGGLVSRASLDDDEEEPGPLVPAPPLLASIAKLPPPTDEDDEPAAAETPDEPIRGTLDGELDLAPSNPGGSLAIRGIGLPFGVLDGDIQLAPHDDQLLVKLDARMPNVAVAHVSAELAVPAHPFNPATWRGGGGRSLLRGADASIDKVRINAAMLERLGIAQKLAARGITIPYRASVAAKAHFGAGMSDAKLNLDITGVRGGPLAQSLAEHLELTVDHTGTVLHGEMLGGGTQKGVDGKVPLGTLDATLAMTMAQWQATPKAAMTAALSARWILAETDAIPVLAIVGRKELIGGTLAIDAEVRGTPSAPIVDHADITARKLAVRAQLGGHAPPKFDELAISARMADGAVSAGIRGRESSGGALDVTLDAKLAELAAAKAKLTAKQVDLSPIAAILPGRFSAAAGQLDGGLDFADGKLSGKLTITGAALPIAPVIGTLRDAAITLEVKDQGLHANVTGQLGGGAIELAVDTPPDLHSAKAMMTLTKVALLGSRRTEISARVGATLKIADGQVTGDLSVSRTRIEVAQRSGVALLDVDVPEDLVLPGGVQKTTLSSAPPIAKPAAAPAAPAAPVDPDKPSKPPVIALHVALGNSVLSAPDAVSIIPGVDVATVHANAHSDSGLDVTIGESVSVVGRIEIDAGDVDFLGRRYLITPVTSAVTFDGSVDPLLEIQMSYGFPSMTLTADVRGRVSSPDPHLSADVVGYSDDQLFAFFLGGAPGGDPTTDTGDAVTAALAKVASGAIGRQVNRVLPVKLDSVACAPGTAAASKSCTFGKQLSRRLYLYYSTRPSAVGTENNNEVQLQYRLSNTTLIDVTGGDRGAATADLLSRHPW